MLILAMESTAKAASVALVRDGTLVAQSTQCSGLTHSRTLLPMAEDLLKNAGVKLYDHYSINYVIIDLRLKVYESRNFQ